MDEGMLGFRIQARRGGSCGDGGAGIGTKCGRWNPTSEQVKVLMDLFRSGLRTPTTDQIQKISTELSFYGKIESKNVFYWFQNHKARERQKRRRVSKEHDIDAACFQLDDHHVRPAAPKKYFGEINQVRSEAGAIQTLQLFPLNSYHLEPCSDNLGTFSDECKENKYATFAYAFGREFEHPPLDLRLSFF